MEFELLDGVVNVTTELLKSDYDDVDNLNYYSEGLIEYNDVLIAVINLLDEDGETVRDYDYTFKDAMNTMKNRGTTTLSFTSFLTEFLELSSEHGPVFLEVRKGNRDIVDMIVVDDLEFNLNTWLDLIGAEKFTDGKLVSNGTFVSDGVSTNEILFRQYIDKI